MRTPPEELGDPALVTAVARGDAAALAEAYRRHSGPVLGLARRVLGSRAEAEEVVQDVFVRLWREPARFDGARGSLRSFLLAQAHGRAVDRLRSEHARRVREAREGAGLAGHPGDLEREVADILAGETVRAALGVLTEAERQAVELAYFGGHTYREVAQILRTPDGTVKSRIRSALSKLGAELGAGRLVAS